MKVLFFSPHASVWQHSFPEALVAEALEKSGHEVTYISCDGAFDSYCISMAAQAIRYGAPAEVRKNVCLQCKANRDLLKSRIGLKGYNLDSVLTAEDFVSADSEIEKLTQQNFQSFERDGIPIGKIALYETILHNKKSNLEFAPGEWSQYRAAARNAFLSYFAAKRILAREKPDAIVNYGSLYSVNHVWRALAEKKGITPYLVQGGASLAEIHTKLNVVVDRADSGLPYYADLLNKWPILREHPASADGISAVSKHFLHLFSGGDFVFSSPKRGRNIREHFRIRPEQKVILATLSSYDEIFGAEAVGFVQFKEQLLFETQADWVGQLKDYFSQRPEYFLIVRPHPREFATKGSPVYTENARRLAETLGSLPPNISVNTPQDEISIYDLAEEVDLVLNGWSTVGSELPLFGIPVVGYTEVGWFPPDLDYIAKSRTQYFDLIEQALKVGWSSDRITITYRWFSLLFESASINLSKSISLRRSGLKHALLRGCKDPLWAFQHLRDRMKSKRSGRPVRIANQLQDCRHRVANESWWREVASLLSSGKASLLEMRLQALTAVSAESEAKQIRESMRLITAAMQRGATTTSPLQARLKKFIEGTT